MDYISTRGQSPAVDSAQAVLSGLAPDGGLYVPAAIPAFDWRGCLGLSSQQGAHGYDTGLRSRRLHSGHSHMNMSIDKARKQCLSGTVHFYVCRSVVIGKNPAFVKENISRLFPQPISVKHTNITNPRSHFYAPTFLFAYCI